MRRRTTTALTVSLLGAGLLAAVVSGPAAATPARAAAHTPVSPSVDRHLAARGRAAAARDAVAQRAAAAPTHRTIPGVDSSLLNTRARRDGTVDVQVLGDAGSATAAIDAVGGTVAAAVGGVVRASVPKSALSRLAAQPGVEQVRARARAFTQGVISEGVAESGADTWTAPASPVTVKVGIVDAGFAGLDAEATAGNLPAGLQVQPLSPAAGGCANPTDAALGQHGTAVAEIVHQMAPRAELYLYCIDDNNGFAAAEAALQAQGVTIVNSSLGFPADSRGDGSGPAGSTALVVAKARKAGILWIQSAGNNATDHWSGTLADANGDHLVDLAGTGAGDEYDSVPVLDGGVASIVLQWDQWPTSSLPLTLRAYGYQCSDSQCNVDPTPIDPDANGRAIPISVSQAPSTQPSLEIDLTNSSGFPQIWDVLVRTGTSSKPIRYDLSYWGSVAPSYFASVVSAARAAAGSVTAPADSPYALAVGAACATTVTDGGGNVVCSPGGLESFSSRGPTIDGRVKPDITGWDAVSTNLSEFQGTFYGTSAAAPHVAGAAALVKEANPAMDAAQLQTFLEQRARNGHPLNPPTNATGRGLLTLGADSGVAPPAGAGYHAITPTKILDTRTTLGGHLGRLGAGASITIDMDVRVPGIPADATAVAINLTGTQPTTTTDLAAYQGGTSWPGLANVRLSATDPTAASFAVVAVDNTHRITVRNNRGYVHAVATVLGYFGTAQTPTYRPTTSKTLLDTRTTIGGHKRPLASGNSVVVNPALTPDAVAAVVNLTVTNTQGHGYLTLAPGCGSTTSTLNYDSYSRANLAIVTLNAQKRFCLTNSGSTADAKVQLLGYFGAGGTHFYPAPSPVQIANTRTGNGGRRPGPIGPGGSAVYRGTLLFGVPHDAKALFTGAANGDSTYRGFLTVFQGTGYTAAAGSTLNFTTGRVVRNAAIVGIGSDSYGVYNSNGTSNATVDLYGYFR